MGVGRVYEKKRIAPPPPGGRGIQKDLRHRNQSRKIDKIKSVIKKVNTTSPAELIINLDNLLESLYVRICVVGFDADSYFLGSYRCE